VTWVQSNPRAVFAGSSNLDLYAADDGVYDTGGLGEGTIYSGGPRDVSPVAGALAQLALEFANPIRGKASVALTMPKASPVMVRVLDIRGRQVKLLQKESLAAGRHELTWNSDELRSGVYLYQVVAGSEHRVYKFVVLH
jgi:methionine-rich copper-binding protein CopC